MVSQPLRCSDVRAPMDHCQPVRLAKVYEVVRQTGRWLIPARCLLCSSAACPPGVDLCQLCMADLPAAPAWTADVVPLSGVFCAWGYEYPIDRLVRALKFHGDRSVAGALGALLAMRVADRCVPLPEVLVPVPLHPLRLRERGYNQADEIARHLAGRLSLRRLPRALERIRATAPQSQLPAAQRRSNLAGAFNVPARMVATVAGVDVALIDDVLTTGSTAQSAAQALLEAGARRVELWALARSGGDASS